MSKLAHRVSGRLRDQNPALFKIPAEWTSRTPVVEAERLGLTLELDLRDNLQAMLFFGGTYEPGVLRFLESELCNGDVLVDVGAHIGVHSLVAARRLAASGSGRVVAFEPASDSAVKLRAGAARNGLVVDVVRAALGAGPGETTLFADESYDPHDAGVRSQYGTGCVVERVCGPQPRLRRIE